MGLKYQSWFGSSKLPTGGVKEYRLSFFVEGYSGAVTTIEMGADAVLEEDLNTDDLQIGIRETRWTLKVLAGVGLGYSLSVLDFYTEQEKNIRVEMDEVFSPGSSTVVQNVWKGYVLPGDVEEVWEDGVRTLTITVCDGLIYLRNIKFLNTLGQYYLTGERTWLWVLQLILEQIGLEVGFSTVLGLRRNALANEGNVDPLVFSSVLAERWFEMDFYAVLESIVTQWGAVFFMEDGKWWLVRYADYQNTVFLRNRNYPYTNNYNSELWSGGTAAATYNGALMPLSGGAITYELSWKKLRGLVKLGKFLNKLQNGDFGQFVSGAFTNWTLFFNPTVTRTGSGTAESPYRAKISGVGNTLKQAPIMYQIVPLGSGESAAKKRVRFSGTAYSNDVQKVVVMCNLIIISNGTTYVFGLNEDGKWLRNGVNGLQFTNIDINGKSKKSPIKWEVESIKISDIRLVLANGTEIPQAAWNTVQVEISLFRGIKATDINWGSSADRYVEYENVTVEHVDEAMNFNSRELYYNLENAADSVSAEEVEYMFTDLSDASQTASLLDSNTNITNATWVTVHDGTQREMVVHVLREHLAMHSKVQRVYDGTLWGSPKRRQLITLGSEDGVWQNTSWVYNYARQQTGDVRYVRRTLPDAAPNLVLKKEVKLSDGSVQPVVGIEEPTTKPDTTPDTTIRDIWALPNPTTAERGLNLRKSTEFPDEDRVRFYDEAFARTSDFFFENNVFKFSLNEIKPLNINKETTFGLNLSNVTTNFNLDVEKLRNLNDNKVWIVGGNTEMPAGDSILGIDAAENIGVNIFGSRIATFTPLGNFGVGTSNPLAVIHGHANVSGAADVVMLRATNQTSAYFFSVAINPNANEVRMYNSGTLKVKNPWQFDALVNFAVSPTTVDATTANQIPNFGQLQSLAVGYIFATNKPRTTTTGNITLSGLQTVGGVALAANDLVLVKDQNTQTENGPYLASAGAWTRSPLHNADATLRRVVHTIAEGTFANFKYVNQNTSAITIGSSNILYSEFSSTVETDPIWTAYLNTSRTAKTVWAAPNATNGAATWRTLEPSDINNLASYTGFNDYTTTSALNSLLASKQNSIIGTGYVLGTGSGISFDNRFFVDTSTAQDVGGEKRFLNKTIFRNDLGVPTSLEIYSTGLSTTMAYFNNLRLMSAGTTLALTLSSTGITASLATSFTSTINVSGAATLNTVSATSISSFGYQFTNQSNAAANQVIATDSSGGQAWRTLTIPYISGLSTELSNLNAAINAKATVNGTGYVVASGLNMSYDNREFVDTTTNNQAINVTKHFAGLTTSTLRSSSIIRIGDAFSKWEWISGATSVAGDTSYNLFQGGTDMMWAYLPFHFIASKYVFRRGFVKMAGNTTGTNNTNIAAPTERLDIEGNFRLTGTIKPDNTQGLDGQFYKNRGVGNADTWANITHADVVNLSSFTGFDGRYVDLTTNQPLIGGNKGFTGVTSFGSQGGFIDSLNGITFQGTRIYTNNSLSLSSGLDMRFDTAVSLGSSTRRNRMILNGTGLRIRNYGVDESFLQATERLHVDGNILYTGTLKPNDIAPTTGQFLRASSTTANAWANITHADVVNLSSFTGFDVRYYTETEINSLLSNLALNGFGYVISSNGIISYDNRSFVDTSTAQTINGVKRFGSEIILGATGNDYIKSVVTGLEFSAASFALNSTFGGRLYLNANGCFIGANYEVLPTQTDTLMVGGSIRYISTLKPNGVQNSVGTFLRGNGVGNPDTWAKVQVNDIENFAQGTEAQALIHDGESPNFMHLRTQTPRLNANEVAVGNVFGILESRREFTYNLGSIRIANRNNDAYNVTLGMMQGGTTDALLSLQGGGTLHINAESLRIAKFGGGNVVSRVLVVDINGYVSATSINANGGVTQGLQQVLQTNNLAVDQQMFLRTNSANGAGSIVFQKGSTNKNGVVGYNFSNDSLEMVATDSDIRIGVNGDKNIFLDETPFSFYYGNAHAPNGWGGGNNQNTPQEGDMIVKVFKSGRWVLRKINVFNSGGRDYLIL
jgi:hypothetical protein